MADKKTTADLKLALSSRYAGDAYALFWEVPDGTGSAKLRTADAVAMSLWPSRGLMLHGHELKASRADWLKELKSPEKAESICRFCDHWWVVATDRDIVKDDELPPTWGLMTLTGRGLVVAKQAPQLTPETIDRAFLAGLLRAAGKTAAKDDEKVLRASYQKGWNEALSMGAKEENRNQEMLDKLTAQICEFQNETGISVRAFDKSLAPLIRDVVAHRRVSIAGRREAHDVHRTAQRLIQIVKESGLLEEKVDAA